MAIKRTGFRGIHVEYSPQGDPYFAMSVKEALRKLNERPVGRKLLKKIGEAPVRRHPDGYKVLIHAPDRREFTMAGYSHPIFGQMVQDGTACSAAMTPRADCDNANAAVSQTDAENGKGTPCSIRWNSTITTTKMTGDSVPPFICLAHELIHAYHALYGIRKGRTLAITHAQGGAMSIGEEEFFTVGVRGFEGEEITENKIRAEWSDLTWGGSAIRQRADYP